jgi:hypothetical protein
VVAAFAHELNAVLAQMPLAVAALQAAIRNSSDSASAACGVGQAAAFADTPILEVFANGFSPACRVV